ncbi:MAG: Hpt domain-containing protein [Rhizobiales bacterium]|nr:Hpt domain-containing protein [Hyphomicrobiales bacterium]
MIESSAGRAEQDPAQSAETAGSVLDVGHLSRMTLGDRNLEREVLQLFDQQTAMLAERLRGASATVAASCAHTLKGSARGIGAWELARSAEQVERAVAAGAPELILVIEGLIGAVDTTRTAIARHLQQ